MEETTDKRVTNGLLRWAKIGWVLMAAIACSVLNIFVENETGTLWLHGVYASLMVLYCALIIRQNKDTRLTSDQVTWLNLYSSATLAQDMQTVFFIPTPPSSRIKRLWRKLRKQTELRLFEGRMNARLGFFPYDRTYAVVYASYRKVVVNQDEFFKMKLSGLIETDNREKASKYAENAKFVPADFFRVEEK